MKEKQNSSSYSYSTSDNVPMNDANTTMTLSICNTPMLLNGPSTQGRTTAAIIPSLVFPGVDVVFYEKKI